ncbi:MAG: hypothetical protein ACOCM8_11805 [Acetivibrio ethanolgignens]
MMKKKIMVAMAAVLTVSTLLTGCGSKEAGNETFVPKDTINWTVTSSPGGGSDIYTRMISDIMTKEGLVNDQNIVVTNKTDGSGEIGRNEVANTKGDKADYTLLTFNSGDLMPMVKNTNNRSSNFKIIAVMAVDKQLIFKVLRVMILQPTRLCWRKSVLARMLCLILPMILPEMRLQQP